MNMNALDSFLQMKFLAWLLASARIAGIFTSAPVFSAQAIPLSVRIFGFLSLAYLSLPTLNDVVWINTSVWMVVIWSLGNFLLGVLMGTVASLALYAAMYAGEIFGIQMGFALAQVFDPEMREETPLLGQISFLLATYVFIALKGHLMLYKTLLLSYEKIPVTAPINVADLAQEMTRRVADIFSLGVQFGLPMIGFMLLVSLILGIMSRLIPQMNVFMIGLPLKTLAGIFMFAGLVGVWADVYGEVILKFIMGLERLIGVLSP
ncbi:MAG: flagellar biosynthetic protein FliR [Thermotogae bacterium]|nr:MAG: flagellar biosynthetic protein FliR [Thermotogota bacterium]